VTIIINALREEHVELAMTLIQNSAPYQICQYDHTGQTALHIAIQKNYLDIACALLEKGADINAFARDHGYHRMTPLHYAALTGNLVASRLLLNWGANTSLENGDRLTPATLALKHGFIAIAKIINQSEPQKPKFNWPLRMPLAKKPKTTAEKMLNTYSVHQLNDSYQKINARRNRKHNEHNNIIDFVAYKEKKQRTR
jgi:ankyrin repeat protein